MAKKKTENKNNGKITLVSIANDVLGHYENIERDELKEWERIKTNLEKIDSISNKVSYLYRELADYYITGLTPYKSAVSGTFVYHYPNSGNLFLDRKINAEIEYYKNIVVNEFNQFAPITDGTTGLDESVKNYGEYKRKFTYLKEMNFFELEKWISFNRGKQNFVLAEIIGCSDDYAKNLINNNTAGKNIAYGTDEKYGIKIDMQKEVKKNIE